MDLNDDEILYAASPAQVAEGEAMLADVSSRGVVHGVRSTISYLKNTRTVSSMGLQSFDGEFRQSPQDPALSASVETYPLRAYPHSRSVYGKLAALGDTENICQIHGIEVEHGVLFVAAKPYMYASSLEQHIDTFQTCPMAPQDFCRPVIEGLAQLHSMQIAHGKIRPASILRPPQCNLERGKLVFSDFSCARLVEDDVTSAVEFRTDIKMAASTILFALSGGLDLGLSDFGPSDFHDILNSAEAGFPDDSLFDDDSLFGQPELMDLLRTMVGTQTPLQECLERPFFWSKNKIAEYIGEEIGAALPVILQPFTAALVCDPHVFCGRKPVGPWSNQGLTASSLH